MDEMLFYAKIVLLVVLLYDVLILFRKPEEGSEVVKLDFWKEMERKGINAFLIPSTMVFIICLDIVQEVEIYLSTALFVLSMIYLGYPRPFALVTVESYLMGRPLPRIEFLEQRKRKMELRYQLNGTAG